MSKKLLRLERVKKTFTPKGKPAVEALKGVSFDLYEGEILGLLGVNGAGKSTLSAIIATLHPPSEGNIYWEDKSVYDRVLDFRGILGFCPQHPNLDKTLSLEENLVFAGRCFGQSKQEATLRKDELMERYDITPHKKKSIEALSGGLRQRFLLARTLMNRPKLIILDEPTVGLDPHVRRQLWGEIKRLKEEGATVILTTHYLDEAEALSDRLCFIHNGVLLTIDTPKGLRGKHENASLEDVFIKIVDDPEITLPKPKGEK
ncbi:MAG: Linearmycin resistance ATP-binding protein LnrL [Chlamydiia bacterium]|nr:Linearmycin resistance ATP-binding protein LnrL [Chlamydiia bacterium]MCH9616062.1 Linearmycin resistance ATP-binding protein LnrL [Chlamydiia bacterium]MCH9629085.1 Linearmycin resistance ATP-binding protein LnrL [Chlamydiia bacterium]